MADWNKAMMVLFVVSGLTALLSINSLSLDAPQLTFNGQFQKIAEVNPLEAAKLAIKTGNTDLIKDLDFRTMDPHVAEQVLDLAIDPSFPSNKISDALSNGAVLKMITLSRLSDTQLSQPMPGGGRVRDKIPDLGQVDERSLDESIKNDAGLERDTQFIAKPQPGATTSSEDGSVKITGLDNLLMESKKNGLRGKRMKGVTLSRQGFSAETAEVFEIRKSSPTMTARDPLYPEVGQATEERRLVSVYNATWISIDSEGYLHIDEAAKIEIHPALIEPVITSNNPSAKPFGPERTNTNKDASVPYATINSAKKVKIQVFGPPGPSNSQDQEKNRIIIGRSKDATIGDARFLEAEGISAGTDPLAFHITRANSVKSGDASFSGLGESDIQIGGKLSLKMPAGSSSSVSIGKTAATYQSLSSNSMIEVPIEEIRTSVPEGMDPLDSMILRMKGSPIPRKLTIYGSSLSFTKGDTVETIQSGNQSMIWISDHHGFECIQSEPLSSYAYQPGAEEKGFSIVSFSQEHMVCTLKEKGQQMPMPCTTKCTLIDIPGKLIVNNGIIDYQRFHHNTKGAIIKTEGQQGMSSVFTSYDGGSFSLRYDNSFDTLLDVNVAEGMASSSNPTNQLSIVDQAGHRLVTMDSKLDQDTVSKPLIQSITSKRLLPILFAPDYAVQQTKNGRGIYFLFPGNSQIESLIKQSDTRLSKYE